MEMCTGRRALMLLHVAHALLIVRCRRMQVVSPKDYSTKVRLVALSLLCPQSACAGSIMGEPDGRVFLACSTATSAGIRAIGARQRTARSCDALGSWLVVKPLDVRYRSPSNGCGSCTTGRLQKRFITFISASCSILRRRMWSG